MILARWLIAGMALLPLSAKAQPQQSPAPAAVQSPAAPPPPASQPQTKEIVVNPGAVPGVAPEYQDAARKSRRAREKVAFCQKEATEQKVLPRDRTRYVLDCIDRQPN
jgi:hypothetical protein